MEHVFLNTLQDKMVFDSVYQVTEVVTRETRGASPSRPYWDLRVRDSSGSRLARVWLPRSVKTEDAKNWMSLTAPCFVKATAHTEVYNQELRLVFDTFEAVTDVDMTLFMKTSGRVESDKKVLAGLLEAVKNPFLSKLLRSVFDKWTDTLASVPAAETGRYSASGGALAQLIDAACLVSVLSVNNKDNEATTDVVVTSALLANVGSFMMYENKDGTGWALNTRGRLFGDSIMSYDVVRSYMTDLPGDNSAHDAIAQRVLHGVAAAHWAGALPQSYEAVVVRQAYDMVKAAAHVDSLVSSATGRDFTAFDSQTKRAYLRPL